MPMTEREKNWNQQFRLERAALDWIRLNRGSVIRVPNPMELLKDEPETTPKTPLDTPGTRP